MAFSIGHLLTAAGQGASGYMRGKTEADQRREELERQARLDALREQLTHSQMDVGNTNAQAGLINAEANRNRGPAPTRGTPRRVGMSEDGTKETYRAWNPVTSEFYGETWEEPVDPVKPVKPDAGNNLTSEDAVRFEDQLYTRYVAEAKDIGKRAESYTTILTAAQGAKTGNPASQIAMVFSFMKMLDPTSVVRESEYATAANAAGVPDRIRNTWNKLQQGVFLTPEQVDNFMAEVRGQALQSRTSQNRLISQYHKKARSRGLNPDFVVRDFWEGIDLGDTPNKAEPKKTAEEAQKALLIEALGKMGGR